MRYTYELLLFCHGKASNIQGKLKNKPKKPKKKTQQKNNKQADKPKQNKTKINERTNNTLHTLNKIW